MKMFILIFLVSLSTRANVVGTDAQNFNFGFFLNYAVNSLAFLSQADPAAIQNHVNFNDKLLSSDVSFGLGLTKYLDIGLTLPFLLRQDINNNNNVAYFSGTGNTEQRINAKYKFYEVGDWAKALVLTANRNNIDNNPYTGQDPGLT